MKVKFISLVHGIIVLFVITSPVFSQNEIKPLEDYSTQIGVIVSMMDDLKSRVTASVVNLDQKGTDFLLDEDANRIGAMILHLAATEKYYQLLTFENRGFNEEEKMVWGTALSLGQEGREGIVGQPTDYYLEIWDIVR